MATRGKPRKPANAGAATHADPADSRRPAQPADDPYSDAGAEGAFADPDEGYTPADAWMQTHTGRAWRILDPRPEDVDLMDIATHLAHQCRYNGACRPFYSVAEHCCRVEALVTEWIAADPLLVFDAQTDGSRAEQAKVRLQLQALLHDAAEAYLSDVPRPLKNQPEMASYRALERRTLAAVFEGLGVPLPTAQAAAVVKRADNVVLATERRDLMVSSPAGYEWILPEGPLPKRIQPITSTAACARFLARADDLLRKYRAAER